MIRNLNQLHKFYEAVFIIIKLQKYLSILNVLQVNMIYDLYKVSEPLNSRDDAWLIPFYLMPLQRLILSLSLLPVKVDLLVEKDGSSKPPQPTGLLFTFKIMLNFWPY